MPKWTDVLGGTVAIVLFGFIITTVGIFTPGWVKFTGGSGGLFERCSRIQLSDTPDYHKAAAALEIIAFIVAVVCVVSVFVFAVFPHYGKGSKVFALIPLVALITSIVTGVFAIIGCIVFAAKAYESYDPNYSFFLTLFGSIILIVGCTLLFKGKNITSIGGV